MPTTEVTARQSASSGATIVISLRFPPQVVDASGTVSYGEINNVTSVGVDENGDEAGAVRWSHDEIPATTKAKLVSILLSDIPPLFSSAGVSVDLTPTPYEPGE